MKGFLISQLMWPLGCLVFLSGPYLLTRLIWRYMPDCWLKRLLFTAWYETPAEPWFRDKAGRTQQLEPTDRR
ncbi:hypothetical protein [Pseudoxanthomonas dokdonensis]|uniref:hypothetical protein n=1 Tax=Pseudoxanthomonas dokdonensis TaxID=344882 RepID=UPI0012ED5887|nr:hypothetical protein [Pseudoxanthomonas dokdonensis]